MGEAVRTGAAVPETGDDVLLSWLPLGAGGHSVGWNGRAYEAVAAWHAGRPAQDLYHAALEVRVGSDRFVIEMAPAWSGSAEDRGVTCWGPVGHRWLGRSVWFRYEVRCWRDGVIPDLGEAVDSPRIVSRDRARVRRLLGLVPSTPTLTWGRDELRLGAMWPLSRVVDRHFRHPRIREAFSFHSLFIGGDPYRVPAIYGALVYLQFLDEVWYARGGVYAIVETAASSPLQRKRVTTVSPAATWSTTS